MNILNNYKKNMLKLDINKTYVPLINKILKYDNYEKIKTITNIGITSLDYIENYSKNNNNNYLFQSEIKKYELKINKLEEELEFSRKELFQKEEKSFLELSKLKKEIFEKENNHLNEINEIKKEIEKKYLNELEDINCKNKNLNHEINKIKNEYYEKLIENQEKLNDNFEKKIKNIKNEKNEEINYFKKLFQENKKENEEKLKNEIEKIKNEKNKIIEELKEENKRFKNKYENLELKSVNRGKPYEDALFEELTDYFELKNNNFTIKRRSGSAGKGDFVITNYYSNIRIMLEAKNMPKVSATIKDQLPKYFNDLHNKTNNYDGGIMICSGKIVSKKNYEIETFDNKKVSSYIEDYNLNNPEKIYFIIENLHKIISYNKNFKGLSEELVLNNQVEIYKSILQNFRKTKQKYDSEKELLELVKNNILNMFKIDVDEYITDINKQNNSLNDDIKKQVDNFIIESLDQNKDLNKNKLKKIIKEKYKEYIDLYKEGDKINGISLNYITTLINKNFKKELIINTK